MKEKVLTSVKVDPAIFEKFRIDCIKYKFSLQKLAERAMHLYVTDEEFRRMITNHVAVDLAD